jgi:hypothetical protein
MGLPECYMMKSPSPPEEVQQLRIELAKQLEGMDFPKHRIHDAGWLKRNLSIRNGDHPNFPAAMETIKKLLTYQI